MPVIKFYMPKNYEVKKEDILIQNGKTDISEWEREQIRNYLINFINIYRKWEADGTIIDPVTGKFIKVEFDFAKEDDIPLEDSGSKKGYLRALELGEKQVEWLKRALSFYKQVSKVLGSNTEYSEVKSKSVAELVKSIIIDAWWKSMAKADIKDIEEEEKTMQKKDKEEK